MKDIEKIIDFVVECDKMKSIYRQTKLIGQDRRENDAEHSFHVALMAMSFKDYIEDIDLDKAIRMLLVHDLVEIDAGDTYAYDKEANKDKKDREMKAANRIYSILPDKIGQEMKELWLEFEENKTKEAIFANSIDRAQPILLNIVNDGGTWKSHNVKWEELLTRMIPIKEGMPELYDFLIEKAKVYFD